MKSKVPWKYPLDKIITGGHVRLLFCVLLLLVLTSFLGAPRAQLQQSGGAGSSAAVGATGSAAPTSADLAGCTYNSSLPTLSSGQMGSAQCDSSGRVIISPIPAGTNVIGHVIADSGSTTAVTSLPAIPSGTNLIGYTRPGNACSTTNYESGMVFLPTSSTSVTSTSTCVAVLILNNTSSSAQTVSVQDQSTLCNSGACNILSSFSIPGNSQMSIPLYGAKFTSGIKWNAANANTVMGDVIGNQ